MDFITLTLIISLGINLVMFVPAFIYKTDKLTDISYAVTFAVVALTGFARSEKTLLQSVTMVLVLLWAFRLGSFLFKRINKMKKDVRFDGMRENFWLFLRFWFLQGLTVFVVTLAASLAWKQDATSITWISILGLLIFFKGLIIESVADAQKAKFSSNPANKGKWIDTGIWRWSRHPNYLGEMSVWIGVYLYVFSSLQGSERIYALASPLFIIGLLAFGSGIPILEKSAEKKWGSDKEFQKYKKEVPVLIPTIRSLKR